MKFKYKSQYRYELLKAVWTYRLRDESFEKKLAEVANINICLLELAKCQPLNEFKKDPIKMTKEEFMSYYEKLEGDYRPKLVLKFQDQDFDKKMTEEKKTDSAEDIIEEDESNASIDRKLRAEARRKAKEVKKEEETEKAAEISMPDEEKVSKEVSNTEKINDEPAKSKEESFTENVTEVKVNESDSKSELLKENDEEDKDIGKYEAIAQEHLNELYRSADDDKE